MLLRPLKQAVGINANTTHNVRRHTDVHFGDSHNATTPPQFRAVPRRIRMDFKNFRNGVGPYLMGAAIILALFLTLLQVLHNAVHRGATERALYAERAEAQWRCNASRGPRERDDCIAKWVMGASFRGNTPLLVSADMRTQ